MVWLHALQGVTIHAYAIKLDFARLGKNAALDVAAGPEGMPHRTPGGFLVCAVECCAVGTDNKTRN